MKSDEDLNEQIDYDPPVFKRVCKPKIIVIDDDTYEVTDFDEFMEMYK
jgi:hypothetical protein